MKFKEKLISINACPPAIDWVGDRDEAQAWRECKNGAWMLWYAAKLRCDRRKLVLAAARTAELVRHLMPAQAADALEVIIAYGRGKATDMELARASREANSAAAAAAADSYAAYAARAAAAAAAADSYAAYAARAAAYAATAAAAAYAAYADYAAYAADYAADSYAYGVAIAKDATLRRSADICRETWPTVKDFHEQNETP